MSAKTQLLKAIAGRNRGLLAQSSDRQIILDAIDHLEDENPTPQPIESNLLAGDWRLIYTTNSNLLFIDLPPLVRLGQIYQSVRPATGKLYNIAEVVSGLPGLSGLICVSAKFTAVSDKRVDVKFQRWIIGLQNLLDYQSPEELIDKIESGNPITALDLPIDERNQDNWLDITYLDEDLRIGRGHRGNLFVLTKD
ncbi:MULTISPECIES: PAP/fibrillin family protein [Planktothricoides]|uniref:PAP/fibrillin family protein n=2 Tax=Planktothricoides raciborskii TaxID=132608 RepID=A0AAU8J8U4_9CYAN|nr:MULTISPECIES: PAP/fibrillin family protein [Planktothricoides]KOR34762.1 fibrillin [Planktothricoides sp. SR001]MBD2547121.1 PAP/fibrillin family protein [Planktothricoides raciborskii FACHB-1370]MBD2585665.1 PAP/fibrillin family protein [Planktothricoides raciborskii FACHB-1261]